MKAENKQKVRECAEKAELLFQANRWSWVDGSGPHGQVTADDIYRRFREGAKRTRREVRAGKKESTYNLGRLIVRTYKVGTEAETLKPIMITEFGVETGYVHS